MRSTCAARSSTACLSMPLISRPKRDIAQRGEPGKQRRLLKHDAAVEPGFLDRLPLSVTSPSSGFIKPVTMRQERAFAAAGRTEQTEEFVARDGDLETFEGAYPAILSLIGMIDAGRLDDELGGDRSAPVAAERCAATSDQCSTR